MKKAVIYGRVSTIDQDFQSQFDDLKRYAKANDYNIVETFGEKVSGYSDEVERKVYGEMKEFIIQNNINQILVWELSRLSRRTSITLQEIEFFTKHNVDIYFKKENLHTISDNAINKVFLTILSSMAEMERSNIIERSKRGLIRSVEQGKATSYGTIPYGYTKDDDGYIIIEEKEAEIIKLIYQLKIEGMSLRGIGRELSSKGIPTRRTTQGRTRKMHDGSDATVLWQKASISRMLKSRLYIGERTYKNLIVSIPPIIDTDTFDRVQQTFIDNIGHKNKTKYDYLLKSKLRCGHCGSTWTSKTVNTSKANPYTWSIYQCGGKYDPAKLCKAGQFQKDTLENQIWKIIVLSADDLVKHVKGKIEEPIEDREQQIEFFKKQLLESEQKSKRIAKTFMDGFIDDVEHKQNQNQVKKDIKDSKDQIIKIEKEISNIKLASDSKYNKSFIEMYGETDYDFKRDFMNKFIDKIEIRKVTDLEIDLAKHQTMDLVDGKLDYRAMQNPNGNDKIIYIEMYSFFEEEPIKAVITNVTKSCLIDENLEYENGLLVLN